MKTVRERVLRGEPDRLLGRTYRFVEHPDVGAVRVERITDRCVVVKTTTPGVTLVRNEIDFVLFDSLLRFGALEEC